MGLTEQLRRAGRAVWRVRESRTGFVILWLLVVVFFGRAALKGYRDYAGLQLQFDMFLLASAFTVLLARFAVTTYRWVYILNVEGKRLGVVEAGKVFYVAQLSSYIPGGVWQFLDMGYRAAERGKEVDDVAHSILYLKGVHIAAALATAVAMAAVFFQSPVLLVPAAVFVLLAFLSPPMVDRVKQLVPALDTGSAFRPSTGQMTVMFVLSVVIWLMNGAFLTLVVASLVDIAP
ncbi:MAG: hypothetical protein SVW77_03215 [Candidatus Nanohaloarchaea archaeon]|nr:hypothetical protein [Candidatus Nanohaloarchaea archaeon]